MLAIIVTYILIITIFCSIYFYLLKEYHKQFERNIAIRKEIQKKYIKVDVRLWNAVLEAYEQAVKNNNQYEEKIFQNLLNELRGKW